MQNLIEIPSQHTPVPRGGFAAEETEPQGFSFTTVHGALRRRKGLIFTTFIVVMAAVFGLLYVLPTQYTASASLVVEQGDTRVLAGKLVARGLPEWMPGDNSIMATQINILTTRALATQVVKKFKLADDPAFRSVMSDLQEQVLALAQRWFPSFWRDLIPWDVKSDPNARHEQEAVQHLLRKLSVQQQGTSHVIAVSFTANDPKKAAQLANAVVTQYLDNQIETKYQATNRAYTWEDTQLRAQGQQLLKAERAAVDYMAAHGLTATNGLPEPSQPPPYKASLGGLAAQQLTSQQDDLAAARTQLAIKQARLHEIETMPAQGASYESLPEAASSPIIAELTKHDAQLRIMEARLTSTYKAGTPVLDQIRAQRSSISSRIAAETANIVQNIRDEAALAGDRVDRLETMMREGRDQYAASERASVELRELTRDASAKRAQYETLLAQKNEIGQQLGLIQPDAELISAAVVPVQPSFPNKVMIAGVGLIGALAIAMVLAGLVEYHDHGLHTGEQVERMLGITNLGLVPLLERRNRPHGQQPHSAISRQPQSMFAETIRVILMQLIDRVPGPARVILVTSALPGEGKTTIAMSLAAAAARLNRRTVVVDFDLRHPSVAHQAGLSVGSDLIEYMTGTVDFDGIIHADPEDARLHIIPLRASGTEAPDRLHTWNVQRLIDSLRSRYECIFLDLPPSLALSDIGAVGPLADTAVFVVQWGKTSRSAAISALAALARLGISVAGVALTQVDLARHAMYGYQEFGEYHKRYLEYFRQFGGIT